MPRRVRLLRTDAGPRDEVDAFLSEQFDAPFDDLFVELHDGDTVHQQAADSVGLFVDGHRVPGAVQLGGGGKAGGPGADNGDPFAGPHRRWFGARPNLRQSRGR